MHVTAPAVIAVDGDDDDVGGGVADDDDDDGGMQQSTSFESVSVRAAKQESS